MSKDKPLISVVVPAFNVEKYLSECLLSILNQTYKNLEIILVNDGSTDTTGKICDNYASRDKRIKVIHKLNSGVSGARNTALLIATGDYVTFVDADDILPGKAIEQLSQIASKSNADCITGALQTFIDETAVDSDQNTDTYAVELVDRDGALEQLLYQKRIINGPMAKLYKASLLKNMEFKVGITVAEDLYFNYQALKKVKSVAMTNSTVYLYRLRDGSAMRRAFNKKRMDGLYITELILKDAQKRRLAILPATDRLFMESIFIGSQIIHSKEYVNEYEVCKKIMRKYCTKVVRDRGAPSTHRLIAATAIVSADIALILYDYRANIYRKKPNESINTRKKVLVRFYNAMNLGDDLFVKIIAQRYYNTFTISRNRHNQSLSRISNLKRRGNRLTNKLASYIEKLSKKSNLILTRLARENDILVYIGGSIFIEGDNIQRWFEEKQYYRDLKIPYYIIGSNIGPYESKTYLPIVKDLLAGSTDVCLRDKTSYELVNNLPHIRLATDIAFVLDTAPYRVERNEKTAIFSLIDAANKFDNKTKEKYESTIQSLTTRLVADGYKVVYMSFCEFEGDEIANKRIRAGLTVDIFSKVEEFSYHGNLDDALSLLAASEIIVASRFHATILGLVFGKKVLPMAYSDKTTDILTDMAFPGTVVDIRKINEFDPMTFDFNTIPIMDVAKQRALAETQFQELDKVLVKKVTDA